MTSKIGLHINAITDGSAMRDFILEARPVVVKTLDLQVPFWEEIKRHYPGLLLIGRWYIHHQPLEHPEAEAEHLAWQLTHNPLKNIADAWEGYNEPSVGKLVELAKFDKRMAEILHSEGMKYVACSWSTGVPDIPDWQRPELHEALRVADYIGVHEYNAPRMDDPRGVTWLTLRYRRWYPDLPDDCKKPLLITECGIDSGSPPSWDPHGQGGWRSFTDETGYMGQLAWYDEELQQDDYVVGATPFLWGTRDPTWHTFDFTPALVTALQQHILTEGVQPQPPDPTPEGWVNITDQLPTHPTLEYGRRPVSDVDTIVIHHSATSAETTPEAIANWHVWGKTAHKKEWPGIGYHLLVYADGTVYQVNDLATHSNQAGKDWNHRSIGVCLVGNFMKKPPPDAQLQAAHKVLEQAIDIIGHGVTIKGHKEVGSTECPGDTYDKWHDALFDGVPPGTDWRALYEAAVEKLAQVRAIVGG